MITIVEPKESIVKLWGKQRVEDGNTYRLMRYVLRMQHEGKVLLHNVVTGQLVLLSDEETKLLSNLPARTIGPMKELIEIRFLVPEDYDEYRSVNQLRKILQGRSNGDAINHYVILPTTFCNAHCFYCYESSYPRIHMTEETATRIIDYIDENHRGKKVKIGWFGGEPLVGINRIDQISQGLKDRDIPFFASMISNGYLFDEEIVKRSVSLWNLQYIQITLDGCEEIYNKVKAYVNVQDNPYQRVHRNIEMLSNSKISVAIRLNMDFYNRDEIRQLIDELDKRYSANQYVKVYLSLLYNNQGYEPVHHTEEQYLELLHTYDEYSKQLIKREVGHDRRKIPHLLTHQCMADDPYSVMIQPDGSICRCEHENINESYGSIEEGVLDPLKPKLWMEPIERSDYCPDCCMYPFCYLLKRCMGASEPCNEDVRLSFQKRYIDRLLSVYQKSQEENRNETV